MKSGKHPTSHPGTKHHATSDSTRQTEAVLGRWWRYAFAYGGFVIGYFVAMVMTVAGFAVLGAPEEALAQQSGGPTAKGAIPQQRLRAGGWSVTLEVGEYFEATGEVTIKAGSLDEMVATASVTGSAVTIEPVRKGATEIEVTAENSEGSAVQQIAVTVGGGVAPVGLHDRHFCRFGDWRVCGWQPGHRGNIRRTSWRGVRWRRQRLHRGLGKRPHTQSGGRHGYYQHHCGYTRKGTRRGRRARHRGPFGWASWCSV